MRCCPPLKCSAADTSAIQTEIPDGYRPQVSTLLVAPVAPHWAEEVWTAKLRRPGCVITAGWPAAAEPDMVLQVLSICLQACAAF